MAIEKIYELFLRSNGVVTDTRKLRPGTIFFALKGENFDGNRFAQQAVEAGCIAAIVDQEIDSGNTSIIRVDDTLAALQQLANQYRKSLHIPFVAITGSNGKTTTKELTRDVLSTKFRVHATMGNLNNHIGVPLTLLSIPKDCEIAIIEMGANHQGEIAQLCEIADPDLGLITNIGKAHLEGFGGIEGVLKGKSEMYHYLNKRGRQVFVNMDDPRLAQVSIGMNRIPYGIKCETFTLDLIQNDGGISFRLKAQGFNSGEVKTSLAGAYNLHNIAAALTVGFHFKVPPEKMLEAISSYSPENNRSQLKKTGKNELILDAYNANPSSMEHALVNLSQQDHPKKFFVIGDMLELGGEAEIEHEKILSLATSLGLNGITVGPIFHKLGSKFSFQGFDQTSQAAEYLKSHNLRDALILIKGSRGIRLEELISHL